MAPSDLPKSISINLNGSVLPASPFFSDLEGTTTAVVLLEFAGTQLFGIQSDELSGSVTYDYTPATPLPATLPLFATGLGGLGLLGWRRKRKAQATA
jgi:PEP-CTERM motif